MATLLKCPIHLTAHKYSPQVMIIVQKFGMQKKIRLSNIWLGMQLKLPVLFTLKMGNILPVLVEIRQYRFGILSLVSK